MTRKDVLLVEKILRHTTAFDLHQIEYKKNDHEIMVWSTFPDSYAFHSNVIIALFVGLFSTYVTYDPERKKCVLVIF